MCQENNQSPYKCKLCGDTGYTPFDKNGVTYVRKCKCLVREQKIKYFGEYFAEKTLDNYEGRSLTMARAKELMTKYPRKSYFITGKVGLGKTHLLAGMYENLAVNNATVLVLTEMQLVDHIQTDVKGFDAVLIDDLGKIRLADWQLEKFFTFYDNIYKHDIQLVITSNYSIAEIINIYGGAIARRIDERADTLPIVVAEQGASV